MIKWNVFSPDYSGASMFEFKPLSKEAIPAALDKAVRYRVLNEPLEAESICLDVLAIDPENQKALINLLLALTDQFSEGLVGRFERAREIIRRLDSDYEKAYLEGIIFERRAKAAHRQRTPRCGYIAYDWLRRAMERYEEALPLRPEGNDEALLRWNTCARTIMRHADIQPPPDEDVRAAPLMLE